MADLSSRSYAKVVDVISEGEILGLKDGNKSIYLNNTPLQNTDNSYNFQNVTVESRTGTNDQAYIALANTDNTEISNVVSVNVAVQKATPVVRTISNSFINAARVTLNFPQLRAFNNDGSTSGATVDFKIGVQYSGDVGYTETSYSVSGRAADNYQVNYLINLTGAFPVNIRVTRVTNDSTAPTLIDAFSWASYTEITYAKPRYPNTALVAMRFDAEAFGSFPDRAYWIRGVKVRIPSNATVDMVSYPGRITYAGAWDGTFKATREWTNDPCWCLFELLTNARFGFGNYIDTTQLDKWSFYSASQYCNELVGNGFGGQEPRFSCNVNIQQNEDAYRLINDMASVFRAMPYWSVGSLTVSPDKPTTTSYLFNLSNVSEEGFSYSGSEQKTRATVAVVKYFDTNLRNYNYEQVEDQVAIAKYGVQTKQIEAFACTSRGQANRLGRWLLYTEQYETEVIAFTTSISEGVIVRPGMVIDVADPMRSGTRRGGRINTATTTAVTVDDATGLSTTNSPTLAVVLPNGTVETKAVISIAGNVITVGTAFSAAPNSNSVWIYEDTVVQTTQWRVISIQENDDCQYTVNALSYNASKYNAIEQNLTLQTRNVSVLNALPAAPTGIGLSEALYKYQDQVKAQISVTWQPVTSVAQYQLRWRKDKNNWTTADCYGPSFELFDITPGFYEFEVYSVNATGNLSTTALTGLITALGKTAPPANVSSISAILDPDVGVTLNWSPVADLDLQGYEIWQGPAWGSGTQLGLFSATSKKLGLLPAGTTTWWIKALDTSGVYSTTAASTSLTISAAGAPTTSGVYSNDSLILSWTAVSGSLSTAFYEIRYGTTSSTWSTATVLGTVLGTTYAIKGAWSGTRRFFVAAVDLKGNYGAAATYDAVVTVPSQPTVTQQVIDNNVLLQWTDSTQTFPIVSYELRRGSTWAGATVIGTKQGKFTTVFESAAGTYTYWLAGIDSAGNYGTPGSVTALVNQPPDYVLKLNVDSTFTGTKTNMTAFGAGLLASVDTAETWQGHFTSRSWSTPQDQINAGYAYFAMPTTTTAQYYEDVDYGTVLAGTKVTATLTSNATAGSTTITPTIKVKKLVTDAWTTYAGISSVFVTDFRYVRVQYDFTSAGGDDLLEVSALNIRLDSKLRNDSGTGSANSGDTGGTTVNFNISFVDVDSISVTPLATTGVIAVYDFVDAPNPTSFKVLLFNTSGTRVSGSFSWSARGV